MSTSLDKANCEYRCATRLYHRVNDSVLTTSSGVMFRRGSKLGFKSGTEAENLQHHAGQQNEQKLANPMGGRKCHEKEDPNPRRVPIRG